MVFGEDDDDGWEDDYREPQIKPIKPPRGGPARFQANPDERRLTKANGNLIIIMAFSLVVVIDAVVQAGINDDIDPAPAIAIGIVSLLLSIVKYFHATCVDEDGLQPSIEVTFGCVLIAVWLAGSIVLLFSEGGTFFESATSGFFATWVCFLASGWYTLAVWGGFSTDEDDGETGCGWGCCSCLSFKKGVTPTIGVCLIMLLGLFASTILLGSSENQGRLTFTLILSIPMGLILLAMVCIPLRTYGDPDNFLILITILFAADYLIVLLTTMSPPFAPRADIEQNENNTDVAGFDIVGTGFFSAIGLFAALAGLIWNAHVFILLFNADNGTAYGVQGRYIWSFLLVLSATILLIAALTECSNFGSCDENDLLGPAIGLSVLTMVICPFLYYVCRSNEDNGDLVKMDPESPPPLFFDDNYKRLEFLGALVVQVGWVAGAASLTFASNSPFNESNAGFFFTWFGFFFASLYFNAVAPQLGLFNLRCLSWTPPNGMTPQNNFGLALIIFGSITQAIAAGVICAQEDGGCSESEFIAFGLGVIMILLCIFLLVVTPKRLGICALITSYLLGLICYVNLIITTIVVGPFDEIQGNGFFAAWVIAYGAYFNINHYEWRFVEL